MINVLADQYLHNIQSYLPENINLILFDPTKRLPPELSYAEAMLVRTVININAQTMSEIPASLKFIGTASAGTDHVDIDYLQKNGVRFADAAGCNARSVAEYVATALLIWAETRKKDLSKLSMGIVGVGHVGTQVVKLLEKLGITTIPYDPPRSLRENNFDSATLDELLSADMLSFHTPLTYKGDYPTFHWLDKEKLTGREFQLVINSSRGGVIDEKELLKSIKAGNVRDIIIDVWENEPEFSLTTAQKAFIKTPHIAG
ncbi:MAG TPA: NAD(P)-dependent oxidoreductase, partial [Balneolaceae bacterium]|nr:NAD(P)-dependent oxidoreductase [Balneolaceae bacterium]